MRLDEAPVKKKKKNIKITSPSNPMEDMPTKGKTLSATARGGKGASGRQASRTDTSRKARDARRVDKPKPVIKPKPKTITKSKVKPKIKPPKRTPPKKTKNPKKPKKDKVVKTTPTPKPQTYTATDLFREDDQSQEILNAYLALAGTELFQYTNSQTIDGMYNDVAIINVLSRRRQAYTPNRLIELAQVFVKYMWVEDGNLCVDIDDPNGVWDQCVLSFTVGSNIEVAYTVA